MVIAREENTSENELKIGSVKWGMVLYRLTSKGFSEKREKLDLSMYLN